MSTALRVSKVRDNKPLFRVWKRTNERVFGHVVPGRAMPVSERNYTLKGAKAKALTITGGFVTRLGSTQEVIA